MNNQEVSKMIDTKAATIKELEHTVNMINYLIMGIKLNKVSVTDKHSMHNKLYDIKEQLDSIDEKF